MPLLSIIVVTWNNENFIEQALRSCIFAEAADYEVIVVHNASTDRTGQMLRRVTDTRPDLFRVVENERNEGLGEARNIGVRHARGTFVTFLDGDDWYCTDLATTLIPVLLRENADVTVFNHARVWDNGGVRVNSSRKLLELGDCSAHPERMLILDNFNVAWNKAYRKGFLEQHTLSFSRRLYEDIDWHFKCLALAESYYAIPDVLVSYRQRTGSILRSQNDTHFDIIEQYEEVFQFLKGTPEFFSLYGYAVYLHARRLMLNVIINSDRIPLASQPRYLQRMNALLAEWREALGGVRRGILLTLAMANSGRLLRGAVVLRHWSHAAQSRLRRWNQKFKSKIGIIAYRLSQKLPLSKNTVLCEAYWGKKVDCNPLAIAQRLQQIGGYDIVWSIAADTAVDPSLLAGFRSVRKGGFAYLSALARAKYLINNVNFPTEYPKRPGQIFVQTKHGTPLKSMGLDIRKRRPAEMNWSQFADRCRNWDYVISSNPYSSSVWRQGFPFGYSILETGYPRNDVLFQATLEQKAALRIKLNIPEGKKVVLYAPTFRDPPKNKGITLPQSELFNAQNVAKAIGDDHILLIRAHYFDAGRGETPNVRDVSDYASTSDILLITDVLITDYSSIMFDFACLKRPIILYQYDRAEYLENRGTYMDLRESPPGPIVETQPALLDVLRNRLYDTAESRTQMEHFNAAFCPWDDGQAADRVIKAVFSVQGSNS